MYTYIYREREYGMLYHEMLYCIIVWYIIACYVTSCYLLDVLAAGLVYAGRTGVADVAGRQVGLADDLLVIVV